MSKSKKGSAKKEGAKPRAEKRARAEVAGDAAEKKDAAAVDLGALRKPLEEAKASLDAAEAQAKQLTEKAHAFVAGARETYRKADHACEFEGGRGGTSRTRSRSWWRRWRRASASRSRANPTRRRSSRSRR